MAFNIELPDYKNRRYLSGDYSDFKYFTELGKKAERICFLRGTARDKEGATKIEVEYKRDNDPNIGPGYYTPLPPSMRKRHQSERIEVPKPVQVEEKDSVSSDDLIEQETKPQVKVDKVKKINKCGLMWGRRAKEYIPDCLGPADTPFKRFPESLNLKKNKIGFNATCPVLKQPLTISTCCSPLSSADEYKPANIFKSSFERKKEFDPPVILCVQALKDICSRCKKEINEDYFFIHAKIFVCRKCYKEVMESKVLLEKIKFSEYKQGRYCTRYHLHHTIKGFDKKMPYKLVFDQLKREAYYNQYTGGRFSGEGIPSKDERQASTNGSKIYQSLFSQGPCNDILCVNTIPHRANIPSDENQWMFEHTLGEHRMFEGWGGTRREGLSCSIPPVFFLPSACSNRSILEMT